ncbi:MAG: hypothetical protein HRU35_06200 [Rickettsiaceae bacterium]|nr:hypothetical protein [Rickettsiaceae bacterium]
MNFKQLYNPKTATTYIIETKAMIFKVVSDDINKQIRLKPFYNTILMALFKYRPTPISYQEIKTILINNKLSCPDNTRLHRKISELRNYLIAFDPKLENLICNIRGVGYSLPLYLQEPELESLVIIHKIQNEKLFKSLEILQLLVTNSFNLSKKCQIIKSDDGFVLDRKPVHSDIEIILTKFIEQQKIIFQELQLHLQDFLHIRIELELAKLKTYLGLVRISEFSITKEQWLNWHQLESEHILNNITTMLKKAEN